MTPIVAEAEIRLDCSVEDAWVRVVQAHIPDIMPGRGPLPGVTEVRNATHPVWGEEEGQERTLVLSDGSTLRETVVAVDRPTRLDYRIGELSSAFRWLVSGADGQFAFSPDGEGTIVRWRYAYHPRSALTRPLSAFVISTWWQPYMGQVLQALAD